MVALLFLKEYLKVFQWGGHLENWNDWLASGGLHPTYGQCIGYKVPLFLGGKDDVSNLELSDLDVYWYAISQTLAKVRR